MENALFASALTEIRDLHNSIISGARRSFTEASRIGELLTHIRGSLKHGEWMPWVEKNLPFNYHTAYNYCYCHEHRDAIEAAFKSETISNLTGAYKLMLNGNGNTPDKPQKLHEPNFHSQAVRLEQNLVGLFTHHLQRRPLPRWATEEIFDLYCSLKPLNEVLTQLEIELNKRPDVPSTYRSSHSR